MTETRRWQRLVALRKLQLSIAQSDAATGLAASSVAEQVLERVRQACVESSASAVLDSAALGAAEQSLRHHALNLALQTRARAEERLQMSNAFASKARAEHEQASIRHERAGRERAAKNAVDERRVMDDGTLIRRAWRLALQNQE